MPRFGLILGGLAALSILCLAALAVSGALGPDSSNRPNRERLGLMGTLPIYWGEADGMEEMLSGEVQPHWARAALERSFDLVPLDSLAGDGDTPSAMSGLEQVLLAQPRALTPAENVALDEWVRAGGHLLLFADPMLTGPTRFGIGDRRRPQDVVLLSPILTRWGLDLRFDDDQPEGLRLTDLDGAPVPVNLAGHFALGTAPVEAASRCSLLAQGLAAQCSIGKGKALIVADAAILDIDGSETPHETALAALTVRAFSTR